MPPAPLWLLLALGPMVALAFSASSTVAAEALLAKCRADHLGEVKRGREIYGIDTDAPAAAEPWSWTDDDFTSFALPAAMSGPDALPARGNEVFVTKQPVVSEEECDMLIAEAEAALAATHDAGATESKETRDIRKAIGEARVSDVPAARGWLRRALAERLFPLLSSRYGIGVEELTLNDALLMRYQGPCEGQPVHRDASLVSVNVALSPCDGYVGGGTWFEALERGNTRSTPGAVRGGRGCAVAHNSGAQHAGNALVSGERWILVLFVLAANAPQLPRRLKAEAVALRSQGEEKWDDAAAACDAGLELCPDDHQLHLVQSSLHQLRGDRGAARRGLAAAAALYPPCGKAARALAADSDSRPRAALRRYDAVLRAIGDRDVPGAFLTLRADAYDAKVQGALCAVRCCETLDRRAANGKLGAATARWREEQLHTAVARLESARVSAPRDPRLVPLQRRAEGMLLG